MAPRIILYLSYSEITGQQTSLEEFRKLLSKFPVRAVLLACSLINCVLHSIINERDEGAHDQILLDLFPKAIADRLQLECRSEGRAVFHRQQLLFVAREALSCCREDASAGVESLGQGFGLILLMANDLLVLPSLEDIGPFDKLIHTASQFIPIGEASGFHQPLDKIIRSHLVLSRFLDNNQINFQQAFADKTGLSIEIFQSLCFAAVVKFTGCTYALSRSNPSLVVLDENYYADSAIAKEHIKCFFDDVGWELASAREYLARKKPKYNDYTIFKDKPLVKVANAYCVVDLAFLIEKLESSLFWRVHASVQPQQSNLVHSLWGKIFERYLNWFIEASVNHGVNRFIGWPKFADSENEEVCDAIILCDDAAAFFEFKGSTFKAEAKYGGEPDLLKEEIDNKIIGTREQPNGATQLMRSIEQVFDRRSPRLVKGIDLSHVRKVFPVVVTRDDIGSAWLINHYVSQRYRLLFCRKGLRKAQFAPIFLLAAEDVEKLGAYLSQVPIVELLEMRYRDDPKLLRSFWTAGDSILNKYQFRRSPVLEEAYKEFSGMVQNKLGLVTPNSASAV